MQISSAAQQILPQSRIIAEHHESSNTGKDTGGEETAMVETNRAQNTVQEGESLSMMQIKEKNTPVKPAIPTQNPSIVQIPGESVIRVIGVPDPSPEFGKEENGDDKPTESPFESIEGIPLGKWFIGREVTMKFRKQSYSGKVVSYDLATKMYLVALENRKKYEVGFTELQEILVPLDINCSIQKWLKSLSKSQTSINTEVTKASKSNSVRKKKRGRKANKLANTKVPNKGISGRGKRRLGVKATEIAKTRKVGRPRKRAYENQEK